MGKPGCIILICVAIVYRVVVQTLQRILEGISNRGATAYFK